MRCIIKEKTLIGILCWFFCIWKGVLRNAILKYIFWSCSTEYIRNNKLRVFPSLDMVIYPLSAYFVTFKRHFNLNDVITSRFIRLWKKAGA